MPSILALDICPSLPTNTPLARTIDDSSDKKSLIQQKRVIRYCQMVVVVDIWYALPGKLTRFPNVPSVIISALTTVDKQKFIQHNILSCLSAVRVII
jgi:hypothetical protein